jgi:molybdate transport system substrate-binding protein
MLKILLLAGLFCAVPSFQAVGTVPPVVIPNEVRSPSLPSAAEKRDSSARSVPRNDGVMCFSARCSIEDEHGFILAKQIAQKPCGTITVAAAADLTEAINEIVENFQKATGCTIRVSTGSSGNFLSQIENGAPFDIFFSADIEYPKKLEAEGFAAPASTYLYAVGKIVLWVRNDTQLDIGKGLGALRDPSVRKIAIANPQHAPYGRAAQQALQNAGVYDAVKDRLVQGENISQAAQFVESGNADAGIVALSLALSPGLKEKGRFSRIPENLYSPIEQGVVLVGTSKNRQGAQAFLNYIKTPVTAALLERYGFTLPAKGKP